MKIEFKFEIVRQSEGIYLSHKRNISDDRVHPNTYCKSDIYILELVRGRAEGCEACMFLSHLSPPFFENSSSVSLQPISVGKFMQKGMFLGLQ